MIPIFIISYNNGWLVEKMVKVLIKKFKNHPIYVIDNGSTNSNTIEILKKLSEMGINVYFFSDNKGPWRVYSEPSLKLLTSSPFILTDPDLELSNLPDDTLEILLNLLNMYPAQKIGLALNIFDDDLLPGSYISGLDIKNWEKQFWKKIIKNDNYELYEADVDTTFHIYNPNIKTNYRLRLAGDNNKNRQYTIKHLPWHSSYINSLSQETLLEYFTSQNKISTSNRLILNYLNKDKPQSKLQSKPQSNTQSNTRSKLQYQSNPQPNKNNIISKFSIRSLSIIKNTIRF
jgi:hypothetical protein